MKVFVTGGTGQTGPAIVAELIGSGHTVTGSARSDASAVRLQGLGAMSSGQGTVTNNNRGGFEIYRASKAALDPLVRSYAARHPNEPPTLLLVAPGWVQTELGGPNAALTFDQGIPPRSRF